MVIIVDIMTYVVKRITFVIQLPSLIVGWDGGFVQVVNTYLMVAKEAPFLCKGILTGANVAYSSILLVDTGASCWQGDWCPSSSPITSSFLSTGW